jgi:hypothetical protein
MSDLSKAEIAELLKKHPPPRELRPKRKPAVLAPVSERMAAAVRANPESLRVSAKAEDGVTVIERPDVRREPSRVTVIEVDANGRPTLVQTHDQGGYGFVKYEGGYGPPTPGTKAAEMGAGARHEYNPLDGLRRRDDE